MSNPQVTIGVSAVDTARQTLQQVDDKIRGTTQIVEQSGSRITAIGQRVRENWQNLATTAAGLTAGVVGFATSFSTLEKAKVSTDRATLTYNKSLERLKEMQEKGTYSAAELANQQEQVRLNTEKAKLAQDNLSDTYANFLANIPSQLMSFGIAAIGIFNTLKVSQASNAATSVASAVSYNGALASMNASTVATTGAMHGFRLASIAAFLTNPIGIAIIAVTTLIAIFAFNVGGLRDRVFELGGAIMAFLDQHFKPLADAIRWFIDNVAKPLGDFFGSALPSDFNVANAAVGSYEASIQRTGDTARQVFIGMREELAKTDDKMRETVGIADQLIATVSRAPAAWGDSLAVTDSITATAVRGAPTVTRAPQPSLSDFLNVKKQANGGEGMVYTPTLFMAGEAGPEHYKFTPGNRGSGGSGETHIHVHVGSKEIAHAIVGDITKLQNKQARVEAKGVRQRLS